MTIEGVGAVSDEYPLLPVCVGPSHERIDDHQIGRQEAFLHNAGRHGVWNPFDCISSVLRTCLYTVSFFSSTRGTVEIYIRSVMVH